MKTNSEALEGLFDEFANVLKETVVNGKTVVDKEGEVHTITPDAASLNVVRQFLKDQGVSVAPGTNKTVNDLASSLPFSGEEYEGHSTFN